MFQSLFHPDIKAKITPTIIAITIMLDNPETANIPITDNNQIIKSTIAISLIGLGNKFITPKTTTKIRISQIVIVLPPIRNSGT